MQDYKWGRVLCVCFFCMGGWTTVFANGKISGSGCGWKTATALTPSFRSFSLHTAALSELPNTHTHTHTQTLSCSEAASKKGRKQGKWKGERARAREGGVGRSKHRVVPRLYIVLCHSYRPLRNRHFRGERETGRHIHARVWHRHQVCVMNALLCVISQRQLRFYGCY